MIILCQIPSNTYNLLSTYRVIIGFTPDDFLLGKFMVFFYNLEKKNVVIRKLKSVYTSRTLVLYPYSNQYKLYIKWVTKTPKKQVQEKFI